MVSELHNAGSEGCGWEGYEDLLSPSVLTPRAQAVQPNYSNGVGSEGCDWSAYPELAHVEQDVHESLDAALGA